MRKVLGRRSYSSIDENGLTKQNLVTGGNFIAWNSTCHPPGGGGGVSNTRPPLAIHKILLLDAGRREQMLKGQAESPCKILCRGGQALRGRVCTSVFGSLDPPPTPIMSEATDTSPSFAPRTPAAPVGAVSGNTQDMSGPNIAYTVEMTRPEAGGFAEHRAHLPGATARAVNSVGWRRSGHRRGHPPRRPPPPPLLQARKEILPASPLGWQAGYLQGRRHFLGCTWACRCVFNDEELCGGMTGRKLRAPLKRVE